MSDSIYTTRSGGEYRIDENGIYWYRSKPDDFEIIKTKQEIDDLINKWGNKQWGIYYSIVIICIIVFAVLLWKYYDHSVLVWVFLFGLVLSVTFAIGPFVGI